jgi:hypothetical protein
MDKNWGVIGATAFDQSFNMVQKDAPITDLHQQRNGLYCSESRCIHFEVSYCERCCVYKLTSI